MLTYKTSVGRKIHNNTSRRAHRQRSSITVLIRLFHRSIQPPRSRCKPQSMNCKCNLTLYKKRGIDSSINSHATTSSTCHLKSKEMISTRQIIISDLTNKKSNWQKMLSSTHSQRKRICSRCHRMWSDRWEERTEMRIGFATSDRSKSKTELLYMHTLLLCYSSPEMVINTLL